MSHSDIKNSMLENRVLAYGKEIFARVDRHGPHAFTQNWLDENLMNWTMNDPAIKVQLFRFIDALPRLKESESVGRHLREYLSVAGEHLPGWLRMAAQWLPEHGFAGRTLAKLARSNAEHMARRFIAGSNVDEAFQSIEKLRQRKMSFTIDLLGEATISEAEADLVLQQYLELLSGLSQKLDRAEQIHLIDNDHQGPIPRVNVSVKLSSLFSQFDPIDPEGTTRVVCKRLRPILQAARQNGAFVNFDMEQYSFKDTTLHIFRTILNEPEFRDWSDVGIAIQAYLRDTEDDLANLLAWAKQRGAPVWIRLVKGAYWDYETVTSAREGWPVPVFTEKWQSDVNFERCANFLLENWTWLRPAFGTHNVRSISKVLATVEALGIPPGAYEFQMLYGMGDEFKDVLVGMQQRVRVYTPYGELLPGMAYLVRRLLENTANESFLRTSHRDDVAEEKLLMNPTLSGLEKHSAPTGNGSLPSSDFRNEPLSDFSRDSNRKAMQAALDKASKELGKTYPLVINQKPVWTQEAIFSWNPSHSKQLVGQCGRATSEHALQAIEAAQKAFAAWRDTPAKERASGLRRIAQVMRERRFELAAWIILECGKPWREADADVAEAIDFCEYYATEMTRLAQPHHKNVPGEENETFYEPRGVAVVIAPWNFPLAILCGMTTAALVAGNPVIMKPAEQSSIVAAKFMEVIQETNLPEGVVHFLPGIGEEIGPTLVNHPDVAVIAFTGSLGVGLSINQSAAKPAPEQTHVKRVIAEMGGKNAVIIDSDADLDEAVRGVVEGAFGYQGQKCSAGSRTIVLASVYDAFLNRLIEATRSLTLAPAESPGCSLGPVIDREARDRIRATIEAGQKEARLAYAGELGNLADEGYYIPPHIFAEVPEKSALAQEEIFGPVLSVIKAQDLEEALRIANGTKYALTGGIFSRSPHNIEQVKKRFRVGNLYINRKITGAFVDRQPFGGFKLSGIGSKAGGPDYLLQFLLPRTITENTLRRGFAPEV